MQDSGEEVSGAENDENIIDFLCGEHAGRGETAEPMSIVDTIVRITAEIEDSNRAHLARLARARRLAIRRGEQPHVHLNRVRAAGARARRLAIRRGEQPRLLQPPPAGARVNRVRAAGAAEKARRVRAAGVESRVRRLVVRPDEQQPRDNVQPDGGIVQRHEDVSHEGVVETTVGV